MRTNDKMSSSLFHKPISLLFLWGMSLIAITCSCSQKKTYEGEYAVIEKQYDLLLSNNDKALLYVVELLDVATLNASPLWDEYIESWVERYCGNPELFITSCERLINRVAAHSPEYLTPLMRKLADKLCADGKENMAAVVTAYSYGIRVSPNEHNIIANRLLTSIRLPGNKAPDIAGINAPPTSMLVVFYQSDCDNCTPLLNELTARYNDLQNKGIRIVSISGDIDPKVFESYSAKFPWQDKLCDYQSFNSPNFTAWGVAATPLLYWVDKEGIVRADITNWMDMV